MQSILRSRRDGSEVVYTQGPQIFKVDVNSGVRTLLTNFGRNFGGNWFDPTYELPVSPQPDVAIDDLGRTENGVRAFGEIGMKLKLIFSMIFSMLMCGTMGLIFAEAPTTPKILFTSSRDGNSEIYMMNPDGSEQVNLTQHRASDISAVWSPTGEQISLCLGSTRHACAGPVCDGP